MSYIHEAYDRVCAGAEFADDCHVSLYERVSVYGGPEEGGWWRSVVTLVETQRFSTRSMAERVASQIEETAASLSADARKAYGERCQRECDWCEDRGLDADYLGEPDGPSEYFVVVEAVAGSRAYRDAAVYE